MLTWVVGSGGLLGAAVSRATSRRFIGSPVPWKHPIRAAEVLESDLRRFISACATDNWSLVWAAGAATVGSAPPDLEAERYIFEAFLSAIRHQHPQGNGAFFLASSAGGVYAGSNRPPFDESTAPHPVSAYGEAKLAHEELAARMLAHELPLLIGRLSNLYGPGQDLRKPQGLVSQLCLATARRYALNLFVPMETLRDYLYVDDAAAMIGSFVDSGVRRQPTTAVLRNLASERPMPVAGIVNMVQRIARRPVLIALGTSMTSRYHVRDLRIISRYSDDIARAPITPLPIGVKRVYEHAVSGHKLVTRAFG